MVRGKGFEGYHPSEFFGREVAAIFEDLRTRILELLPEVEVLHVGGTSIPGAITKGDLDVQIRVERDQLVSAVMVLEKIVVPNNREMWNGSLAIFRDEITYHWKIDILVTAKGFDDDNCYKFRELLINQPDLLEEYNDIKLRWGRGEFRKYKSEKDRFYEKLTGLLNGMRR